MNRNEAIAEAINRLLLMEHEIYLRGNSAHYVHSKTIIFDSFFKCLAAEHDEFPISF